MQISISPQPVVALIAGILILFVPRLLNYIVAIYLIIIGILGLIRWLANFYLFRPIHSGEFYNWLADRMLTDDDWKDEEKESIVLIILFSTSGTSFVQAGIRIRNIRIAIMYRISNSNCDRKSFVQL